MEGRGSHLILPVSADANKQMRSLPMHLGFRASRMSSIEQTCPLLNSLEALLISVVGVAGLQSRSAAPLDTQVKLMFT